MKVIKFNDYEFPYNPNLLTILFEKKTVEIPSFFNYDVVQNIGFKNRKIIGEGEFFGESFLQKFEKLKNIFQITDKGKLLLPWGEEITAIFNKLKIVGEGGEFSIKYNFEFIEVTDENINGSLVVK